MSILPFECSGRTRMDRIRFSPQRYAKAGIRRYRIPVGKCEFSGCGKSTRAVKTSGLVAQTLLMAVLLHALLALVLVDLRLTAFLQRAHGRCLVVAVWMKSF